MTAPKPRRETIVVTWTPDPTIRPERCARCGHDHWKWNSSPTSIGAGSRSTWGICGDEACGCSSLMTVDYAQRHGLPIAAPGEPKDGQQ